MRHASDLVSRAQAFPRTGRGGRGSASRRRATSYWSTPPTMRGRDRPNSLSGGISTPDNGRAYPCAELVHAVGSSRGCGVKVDLEPGDLPVPECPDVRLVLNHRAASASHRGLGVNEGHNLVACAMKSLGSKAEKSTCSASCRTSQGLPPCRDRFPPEGSPRDRRDPPTRCRPPSVRQAPARRPDRKPRMHSGRGGCSLLRTLKLLFVSGRGVSHLSSAGPRASFHQDRVGGPGSSPVDGITPPRQSGYPVSNPPTVRSGPLRRVRPRSAHDRSGSGCSEPAQCRRASPLLELRSLTSPKT